MNCIDCNRFSNIDTGGHELNKYNCEHCLVDDYVSGEIQMSKHTDELLDAVENIAGIIYYQLPLKAQDKWLKDIMAKGIWKPEDE